MLDVVRVFDVIVIDGVKVPDAINDVIAESLATIIEMEPMVCTSVVVTNLETCTDPSCKVLPNYDVT